ncbi:MAG: hypothetical protein WCO56_28015 [Verrucomicrobiota bacterium]
MKHLPFQSVYRENFEVVEERRGNLRLYPHTDQLPQLSRALNLEFYGALPGRFARVDHRADGFRKVVLKNAALFFCSMINDTRPDDLRLYMLSTPEMVSKVTIVQQITEHTSQGPLHYFRFYSGTDFFPDIYLSGKKFFFSDHALQRFSSRVPHSIGDDLITLLLAFYGSHIVAELLRFRG